MSKTENTSATVDSLGQSQPVRFFDSREKYLLFVTTTNEKWAIAQRINEELERLKPEPVSYTHLTLPTILRV